MRYRGEGRRLRGWHILGSSDGRLFGAGIIDGEVREHELFKLTYSGVLPFLTFDGDFVSVNEVENGDVYAVNYGKEYWWQGTTSRVGDAVFRIEDDPGVFNLRALKAAGCELAFEWFAASGSRYQLQGSLDFKEWENVGNAVEGFDDLVRQEHRDSSAGKRFYRVVLK